MRYPSLLQINTRVRLSELSNELGRPAKLDDVSNNELDQMAADGFDLVWLLGVWQMGDAARRVSRSKAEWLDEYRPAPTSARRCTISGSEKRTFSPLIELDSTIRGRRHAVRAYVPPGYHENTLKRPDGQRPPRPVRQRASEN